MAKNSNRPRPKSKVETFKAMNNLKSDLYYKQIIEAHRDVIEAGTKKLIDEIMWRFNSKHISIHEMFTELESLKSGHRVTDNLVKDAMTYARRTYCRRKKRTK